MKKLSKIITLCILTISLESNLLFAQEKIKIGLLIPLTGQHKEIGKSIIQSVRLAVNKIDNLYLEILPKDTESDPTKTYEAAKELQEKGIKIVIGPVFNDNLVYLKEFKEIVFLSLTNKNINNPKNVISAGINATSQINTIIKFLGENFINY